MLLSWFIRDCSSVYSLNLQQIQRITSQVENLEKHLSDAMCFGVQKTRSI